MFEEEQRLRRGLELSEMQKLDKLLGSLHLSFLLELVVVASQFIKNISIVYFLRPSCFRQSSPAKVSICRPTRLPSRTSPPMPDLPWRTRASTPGLLWRSPPCPAFPSSSSTISASKESTHFHQL